MTEVIVKPKVFLSYAHADSAWAEKFAGALKESGIEIWAEEGETANGNHLPESLARGLKESDVVVILFDAKTLQSPNALFELGAAMAGNKAVVPVVPPGMHVPRLPVPLQRVIFLAKGSPEGTATKLVEELSRHLAVEPNGDGRETL